VKCDDRPTVSVRDPVGRVWLMTDAGPRRGATIRDAQDHRRAAPATFVRNPLRRALPAGRTCVHAPVSAIARGGILGVAAIINLGIGGDLARVRHRGVGGCLRHRVALYVWRGRDVVGLGDLVGGHVACRRSVGRGVAGRRRLIRARHERCEE